MRTRPRHLALAALIALLLHVFLLVELSRLPRAQPSSPPLAQPSKIQVHLKESKPKQQIVQIRPPPQDKAPRIAEYLSEFNSSVARETQAANKTPTPVQPNRPIAQKPPQNGKGPVIKRNLLPTWKDLERQQMPSAFNDHIEKAETAAQTELNTFEWKHAAYFNRIKENISRSWSPILQIKRYDPGAALIGKQNRLTVVEATLDTSGNLIDSRIKTSCGVFYLDDEAINSIKKASPFPHPPKALFAEKDNFSFTFGFMVSVDKRFSLDFD